MTIRNDLNNRRQFLKTAAGTAIAVSGFPYIVPSSALGKAGDVAPSNRVTMGCIGVGWQGTSNLKSFIKEKDCQIVAISDIDKKHLRDAVSIVNGKYSNKDCATYHDFRELLARDDIDTVSIGLPDHWHSIPVIIAARSGKDIYGEKPLSHSLKEGRAMCDAVNRYGRIWQTGSWQRSESHFRFACELVRNGRIGKIHTVEVGLPAGHSDFAKTKGQVQMGPPPAELDYDLWLGPAPYAPYCPARVHKNWRWHLDYPKDGLWNTATKYRLTAKYPDDITMIIAGGHSDIRMGTKWIGEDGWVWVNRGGKVEAEPKKLVEEKFGPNDIHLFNSPGHWRNFLDCVKTRKATLTPCEVAHRSATPGHLGQIAMLLGRKIRFNPETEEIIDDPTATKMLSRAMRSPWHI